jgi:hypothetical protein
MNADGRMLLKERFTHQTVGIESIASRLSSAHLSVFIGIHPWFKFFSAAYKQMETDSA